MVRIFGDFALSDIFNIDFVNSGISDMREVCNSVFDAAPLDFIFKVYFIFQVIQHFFQGISAIDGGIECCFL